MPIEHLSYSSINLFTRDPLKWKRGYIDGEWEPKTESLIFGSAFHKTIYEGIKTNFSSGDTLWKIWADEIGSMSNDVFSEEVLQKGIDMFSNGDVLESIYSLNPARSASGDLYQEFPVTLHIPNIPLPLIGYIDLIEYGSNGLLPVDFKTSRSSWNEKRANEEMQATVYIAALNQMGLVSLPAKFKYLVFVKTKTPKVQEFIVEKNIDDVMACMAHIEEVWGMMKGVIGHES